ncbi:4-(cytidine 5'-diphospho)-2-C-methyl-D-erythritol kinase [Patescibacteria group bacterium]
MKIIAPAKVNLCLDIIKKTSTGYHQIQTVFQEVPELHDIIKIEIPQNNQDTSTPKAPLKNTPFHLITDEQNLAYQAYKLMQKTYKIDQEVTLKIHKKIPFNSGLGGASSNAAATIRLLCRLWNINAPQEELVGLASRLGMDVPFFLYGGTALGTSFGEKITPLPPIKGLRFTIAPQKDWPKLPSQINPKNHQKTTQMYKNLDLSKCGHQINKTEQLIRAIKNGDNQKILANIHNDFETLIAPPKNFHLSGSGSAIFKISKS